MHIFPRTLIEHRGTNPLPGYERKPVHGSSTTYNLIPLTASTTNYELHAWEKVFHLDHPMLVYLFKVKFKLN